MGTWSHDAFGNDDASDFASELAQAPDLSVIEQALDAVLAAGEDLIEAPDAARAIAAAEAIARLLGHWGKRDADSESVDRWVANMSQRPGQAMVSKAQGVLDRILREPCELLELWEDTEHAPAWVAAVRELNARVHR